ncbi:bifunctional transcriptional activator/DNA repair enzyme AdaA [Paenibacillus sp. R14(2021)]|uniref:bifunctional transcriptional activator/DNA repair enzyme AdaA n=1 Tax=Paenibacillus sp. R14(2021) TaxID=2859228 RepID=UPI001C614FC5|nr:bifunctional transcriptional activator/DNA repair enzyme AdaA [Paenibacillus sp. R14(2021)]
MLTDQEWTAIVECDAAYDGQFYYGVRTTGIFCRPSCKSRTPKREHVHAYASTAEALTDGLRPCKRCRPDGLRQPDEEWAASIAKAIRTHYADKITLSMLAEQQHVSPFHMHRTFKRICGVTPAAYLLLTRIEAAKQLLRSSVRTIGEIGEQVGLPSPAHFATVFQRAEGCTPTQYRLAHNNQRAEGPHE